MHELTITGPCPAQRMILEDGVYSIGRLPECDISLDGDGISREQARIVVQDLDAEIVDEASMNGTLVEGKPVERHRLEDGDVIGIGRYRLLYRCTIDPSDVTEVAEPEEAEGKLVPLHPEPRSRRRDAAPAAREEPSVLRSGGSSRETRPEPSRAAELPRAAEPEPRQVARSRSEPRLALGLAVAEPQAPELPASTASKPSVRRLRVNFKARLALAMLGLVALCVVLIGFGVIGTAEEMMA